MDTAQLINALSRPEAYRFAVDRVEVRQTHISVLFLAGNRVYKVKRPVDLGYLDYTSLPQRRHFCQEEVRLNRRLAGDVYLGVVAVVRSPDGNIRFAAPEEAADVSQIIDYAVEMRRLPQERMLSSLLERGEIDTPLLDDIADVLLRFHQAAATGPGVDEHGTPEGVVHAVLGNLHWIESFAAGADATLSAALFRYLRGSAASFLDHNRALLERRVRAGHIRDGHGDLHAGTDRGRHRHLRLHRVRPAPALRRRGQGPRVSHHGPRRPGPSGLRPRAGPALCPGHGRRGARHAPSFL
ncbi:MAG: hypothetical protein ACYTAQ_14305 [Planctomycetota bacterium]